ncbi:biosynthetic-type acetolactate synthase large subunit [Saliterribacillus persicus]|uniref:Acetolactate synthase n=1 Tax=Saliterribacillus persicus TaxID=930114 RepID=A0A368YBA9_9BACI|nr:biosynthetic-type acetolactate synthase large subunit [Saliterribacillus persicus]RCW77533.1 acetolactate synthase large subunit [Saliterribacillus persicus]
MEQLMNKKQTGLDVLCQVLIQEQISVIFQPNKQPTLFSKESPFDQIQLTHEQAVIHAADGYSRATGKVGIAFITTEYGFTNAVTGIGTAQLDSVPLVVFVQHPSNNVNEQLNVSGMTKASSKYSFTAKSITDLISMASDAITIAISDRPGVVVLDYPSSILYDSSVVQNVEKQENRLPLTPKKISPKLIEKLIRVINESKRPVLLVGGGALISGASTALLQFIERTSIPFVSTLMGLGVIDKNHPLHLGMVGMHGTFAANRAVHKADLLICLGVRFSDRITGNTNGFSPNSKKIHVDIDPSEINKRVLIDYPVIGDIKQVLELVNRHSFSQANSEWLEKSASWSKKSAGFHEPKNKRIGPDKIIKLLHHHSSSNAIVATDVGQHQMWTAHHYPFQEPRRFLTSGGFGTMGYGLPAAIGGAMASPTQEIICVTGDGSIQMNIQELLTAVRYRLNIKIAILKNGYLGMVRQWQQLFYERNYSQVKITSPDYVTLAESYGAKGYRAKSLTEAKTVIEKAFSIQGPVVMEFTIEDEQNVYPIVPPGGNNTDALGEEVEKNQ